MSSVVEFKVSPPRPPQIREFLAEVNTTPGSTAVNATVISLTNAMVDAWDRHEFTPAEAAIIVSGFTAGLASVIQDETGIDRADFGRAMLDMIMTAYTKINGVSPYSNENRAEVAAPEFF